MTHPRASQTRKSVTFEDSDSEDDSSNQTTDESDEPDEESEALSDSEEESESESPEEDEDETSEFSDGGKSSRGRKPLAKKKKAPPTSKKALAARKKALASKRAPTARRIRPKNRAPSRKPSSTAARLHRPHGNSIPGRRRVTYSIEGGNYSGGENGASKAQIPTVRLTYRPRVARTGKRERLMATYGCRISNLVKAGCLRDRTIGLPALPEEGCFAPAPFWEEGQDELVDLGNGRGKEERLDYYDESHEDEQVGNAKVYLPSKDEPPIKCIIGPGSEKQLITFQRFGIFNLAAVPGNKRGYILNAGGHVLSTDWVPNRPQGIDRSLSLGAYVMLLSLICFQRLSVPCDIHKTQLLRKTQGI